MEVGTMNYGMDERWLELEKKVTVHLYQKLPKIKLKRQFTLWNLSSFFLKCTYVMISP
jgi:hypothetical protein